MEQYCIDDGWDCDENLDITQKETQLATDLTPT